MGEHKRTIGIEKEEYEDIEYMLSHGGDTFSKEDLVELSRTYGVTFENGYEMNVHIKGFSNNIIDIPFAYATLHNPKGELVDKTESRYSIKDEWELTDPKDKDTTYCVKIVINVERERYLERVYDRESSSDRDNKYEEMEM